MSENRKTYSNITRLKSALRAHPRCARMDSSIPGVLYWPQLPVQHLGPNPRCPQVLKPRSHPIINLGYVWKIELILMPWNITYVTFFIDARLGRISFRQIFPGDMPLLYQISICGVFTHTHFIQENPVFLHYPASYQFIISPQNGMIKSLGISWNKLNGNGTFSRIWTNLKPATTLEFRQKADGLIIMV